ncbi:MAG: WG repeat-containing protein, partial [bacterium]
KVVVQPRLDFVGTLSPSVPFGEFPQGTSSFRSELIPAMKIRKWGYINRKGKFVVKPNLDEAGSFHEGLAVVRQGRSYGYIDENGKTVTPIQYEDANDFSDGRGRVKVNGQYGYLDAAGKMAIAPLWESADDFSEGLARVDTNEWAGFIGTDGEYVIEPTLDSASAFREGRAAAWISWHSAGFIGRDGKWVIQPRYRNTFPFHEGIARVEDARRFAYINGAGRLINDEWYSHALDFSGGLAAVMDSKGKIGYIDQSGKTVIPPQFQVGWYFTEGRAAVMKGGKWAISMRPVAMW